MWQFYDEADMKRMRMRLIMICGLLMATLCSAAEPERYFYVYNSANGLADNSAQTINCTKTGRLVITTIGQINFFDGQQFHYIDPTTENTYSLKKYNGHAHLYFDKHHHIWLKKRHNLSCVDLIKELYAEDINDEFKKLGIEDQVEDLFADEDNELWLLTEKGLYSIQNQKYYKVDDKLSLQELGTYQNKYLLLFYENGRLDILDQGSGSVTYSEMAYDNLRSRKYASTSLIRLVGDSFFQIRNGNECGILMRFNMKDRKWDIIMETPYYLSNIVEHDSTLYIPSAYGYWTYELASGQMEHIERLRMSNGQLLLTDINAIEFDKQGGLWIGTEKRGLLYARPSSTPFKIYSWTDERALVLNRLMDEQVVPKYTYREKSVNCVFRDSRGWDWVGTSTGLQVYRNASDHLPQLITRDDGLLNNVVHCVIEDNNHHIWVGSSYGICCIVLKGEKVRFIARYNNWDGIPSESFVNGRSLRLPDGSIVMQALDHVIEFNPNKMATLSDTVLFELYPKLVRLFVNGNDIRIGDKYEDKVILERALSRTRELNLNYDQNSLSLTFSGLNYFRPQQTYYRVRVSGPGMENRWKIYTPYDSQGFVDSNGQLHLPLVSLLPGTYKIEVQSSMLPDIWNTTPYEWQININQPWWRTTGIFVLMTLLFFVMLIVYLYLYVRNANMRARRNNEEHGIIRRIRSFVDRCDSRNGVVLEPLHEEMMSAASGSMSELSPAFIQAMEKIIPILNNPKNKTLSMRSLSSAAGMKLEGFYALVSANVYKNPRPLALHIMLNRATDMLLKDKQRDIAEISKECGFISPNFFIAAFYHRYHQTPESFRWQ